jgi:hypothetical protein
MIRRRPGNGRMAMWARALNILKILLLGLLLLVLLPLILLLRLIFGDKSDVSREEVLVYLGRMGSGEVDRNGWDDFFNVPIKHPELDSIRGRCKEIWQPASGYMQKDRDGGYELNQAGFSEIANLIKKCESISYRKIFRVKSRFRIYKSK